MREHPEFEHRFILTVTMVNIVYRILSFFGNRRFSITIFTVFYRVLATVVSRLIPYFVVFYQKEDRGDREDDGAVSGGDQRQHEDSHPGTRHPQK